MLSRSPIPICCSLRDRIGWRQLISAERMEASYPKAWAYLTSYRDDLRLREAKRNRMAMLPRLLLMTISGTGSAAIRIWTNRKSSSLCARA
jgi:hypothetical protein